MRAKRTDANHRDIVQALRACGWLVADTHALPKFVDAVAWHPGRRSLHLLEFKTAAGKLEPSQAELLANGWPLQILRTVEDAARLR